MREEVINPKRPSTLLLAWDYSISYRRLAIELIVFIAIETLWFVFAGYELRRIGIAHASTAPLTKCVSSACGTQLSIPRSYIYINPITTLLLLAIPFTSAFIFLGPSFASELESRAVRTLWAQATTRKQWLASRVIPAFSFTILTSTVAIIEANRWFLPHAFLGEFYKWNQFAFRGLTFIGLALCSTAAIIGFSVLIRKIPFAIVATALFMAIIISAINSTYPTLIPPKTAIANPGQYSYPSDSLFVSATTVFKNGHEASVSYVDHVLSSCNHQALSENVHRSTTNTISQSLASPSLATYPPKFNQTVFNNCVKSTGLITLVSYQPANRYWPLQMISFGILLAITFAWGLIAFLCVTKVEP